MTFARPVLLLTLSVLIAGCATSAEQQATLDSDQCVRRGHQPESKAHDDCMLLVASARAARLQSRHRELVERPATYGR
jgi:hypothetical protein